MSKRLLAALFLLGLVATACSSSSSDSQPSGSSGSGSETIRIGVEGPLTGDQGSYGQGMLEGAQFAADEINAAGGIGGTKITIIPIDDQADAETGVKAAKAAIAEGLDAVIGPYNSSVGVDTLPLYEEAGLVPVRFTTANTTEGLGGTVQPRTSQIAPVATRALRIWLEATKIAVIYDSTEVYTKDANTAMKQSITDAGGTIAAEVGIEPGAESYTTAVDDALAANPDAIYVITYYPEAGVIAKDMAARNATAKCLADYSAFDAEYVVEATPAGVKRCPVVGLPGIDDFPGSETLVPSFRKKFGSSPGSVRLRRRTRPRPGGRVEGGLRSGQAPAGVARPEGLRGLDGIHHVRAGHGQPGSGARRGGQRERGWRPRDRSELGCRSGRGGRLRSRRPPGISFGPLSAARPLSRSSSHGSL
ncbi:MAG: branched-chain amino acid ABC transporter substrate-binding protein [Actinomycetota bacterium]